MKRLCNSIGMCHLKEFEVLIFLQCGFLREDAPPFKPFIFDLSRGSHKGNLNILGYNSFTGIKPYEKNTIAILPTINTEIQNHNSFLIYDTSNLHNVKQKKIFLTWRKNFIFFMKIKMMSLY